MTKQTFLLFLLVPFAGVNAQVSKSNNHALLYIEKYKAVAISEMENSGVPASITLAQGLLESCAGTSDLATEANNHFGIKAKNDWLGEVFRKKDDDDTLSAFRKYVTAEESFRDHTDLLRQGKNYSALFYLKPGDYKGWAKGLKKAGYATLPDYAERLIAKIEELHLNQYDRMNTLTLNMEEPVTGTEKTPVADRKARVSPLFTEPFKGGIQVVNGVNCVMAFQDELPLTCSKRMDIPYKDMLENNDMKEGDEFAHNQYVFTQPKQDEYKGAEEMYIAQEGATMYDIAERYGIKLSALCSLNNKPATATLEVGTPIRLRAKAPERAPTELAIDNKRPTPTVEPLYVPTIKAAPTVTKPTVVKNNEPVVKDESPTSNGYYNSTEQGLTSEKIAYTPNPSPLTLPDNIITAPKSDEEYVKGDTNQGFKFAPVPVVAPARAIVDGTKEELKEVVVPEAKPKATPKPIVKRPVIKTGIAATKPTVKPAVKPNTSIVTTKPDVQGKTHTVTQGETLYQISRLYNIPLKDLKSINHLAKDVIYPGQELLTSAKK